MLVNKNTKDILKYKVIRTEKSFSYKNLNTLIIDTNRSCTKDFLKKYFTKIFSGELLEIRSLNIKPKNTFFRGRKGQTSARKRFFLKFADAKNFNLYFK